MEMQMVSLEQSVTVLGQMKDASLEQRGMVFAHRGTHPTLGDTIIIQCDAHAVIVADGVGFL